jgi:plastocyanin
MSLLRDAFTASATGAAVCGMFYAASAHPVESNITIDSYAFKADTITVPIGTTVVWENRDDIPHNVVAAAGGFRSQALDTEDKFRFTFTTVGAFDYFCSLHSFMKGRILVMP